MQSHLRISHRHDTAHHFMHLGITSVSVVAYADDENSATHGGATTRLRVLSCCTFPGGRAVEMFTIIRTYLSNEDAGARRFRRRSEERRAYHDCCLLSAKILSHVLLSRDHRRRRLLMPLTRSVPRMGLGGGAYVEKTCWDHAEPQQIQVKF